MRKQGTGRPRTSQTAGEKPPGADWRPAADPETIERERLALLAEYALGSRVFSDAVERLRRVNTNAEAFIHVLGEVGVANRNCERIRRRLNRHLMQNRLSPDSSL